MAIRPHTLLLCLALLLGFGSSAHAARRVALLIGNGQYQHENTLPNPVRDVRLLASTLKGLDFKTEVLENLEKRDMDLAIKRFVRESAGADSAILYYAGHGQQPSKGGRSYLLPVNAKVQDDDSLEADGILAEDIAGQLERLPNPAKLRLVILDACRNTRATTRSTVRGLAPPARTDSYTLIAYSTDANSVAQDGSGANSPYAKALAKHLPRALKEPVRLVFEDTAKDVRTETKQQQLPRTYGDLESRVGLDGVLVASVGVVPTGQTVQVTRSTDPEEEAWQAAKAANTAGAYDAYLAEYPTGRYASAARIGKAGLATGRPVAQTPSVSLPQASTASSQVPARLIASAHSLVAPDIAENGAVVPVGITFSPPLNAGDVAELILGGQPAATIRVEQGALAQFQTRLRFQQSDTVRLRVNAQDLAVEKRVSVTLPGEVPTNASFAGDPMRIRASGGEIRVLAAAKAVNGGMVQLEADGLRVRVDLTGLISENPFFSFKSPNSMSGKRVRLTLSAGGQTRADDANAN